MIVIPAIDLRGGKAVRLLRGDFAKETVFSDNPVSVAKRWQKAGAPRIHVVDLDGAKSGQPVSFPDFTRGRWKTTPPLDIVHM